MTFPANARRPSSISSELDPALSTTWGASHGKLARDGTKTVDGQKVVAVTDVSQGGTLYVATVGTPFPIEIAKDGGSGGRITFDRWNKPVTLTAPANAININQLQNGH